MGLEDHLCDFEAVTSMLLRAAASPVAKCQSSSMQAVEKPFFFFCFFVFNMLMTWAYLGKNQHHLLSETLCLIIKVIQFIRLFCD